MGRAIKEYETGKGPLATNFIDAAIKLRPTEDVKSMGPEFEKYWDNTLAKKADNPMILSFILSIRPFIGYISLKCTLIQGSRSLWEDI